MESNVPQRGRLRALPWKPDFSEIAFYREILPEESIMSRQMSRHDMTFKFIYSRQMSKRMSRHLYPGQTLSLDVPIRSLMVPHHGRLRALP